MSSELDKRRVYYDHEPAYARIAASGGHGWDDMFPGTEPGSYRALGAFLDADATPPGRALEIGCGGGQAAIELARRGHRVTGLDFSETAVALARANARTAGVEVTFDRGDVLDLPYADASFELVIDNHLLHCIVDAADRVRTLASIHRVLAPGGRLWSDTMAREGTFDAARFHADPHTGIAANHTRIWVTRVELAAELTAAGFVIESMELRQEVPVEDGAGIVTIARRGATMRHG